METVLERAKFQYDLIVIVETATAPYETTGVIAGAGDYTLWSSLTAPMACGSSTDVRATG
jgi:hypothetical protein